MDLTSSLRIYALLNLAVGHDHEIPASVAREQQAQEIIEARAIVEDHLLALGWTNSPGDLPAMHAAAEWARGKVA